MVSKSYAHQLRNYEAIEDTFSDDERKFLLVLVEESIKNEENIPGDFFAHSATNIVIGMTDKVGPY